MAQKSRIEGRSQGESQPIPQSVGRALDLLTTVVEAGDLNLTGAANATGLTPTTALRYLRALESRGYLSRDDRGSFSAGPAFLRLAASAFDHGPTARLVAAASPHLAGLAELTGESSYLAIREGDHAVYVATSESARAIRHVGWVGKAVPLVGTAVGEVLGGADGTVVRSGAVEPDITAIARGVEGDGNVLAALSVIGPAHRMTADELDEAAKALDQAASDLVVDLGLRSEVAS